MTRQHKYDRPYTTWLTTVCVVCRGFAVQKAGEPSNGSICAKCRKDLPNGTTTSTEDHTTTLTVTTESSEQQWQEQ